MPSLVIVESPAKAKTISNFLGKGYIVEASMGHVRDLPSGKKELPEKLRSEPWADFAVNIDNNYEPVYIVVGEKRKKETISKLKQALKNADTLLLATDEDREGESISWHLLEVLKPKKDITVKRIVFHEITREAIEEALRNPRDLDMNLVHAQEARRIVDRLFGYKLSPILWRKVAPGLSAGRVQSVAVRLLVEREEERRSFVTSVYWDLEAEIATGVGSFKATLATLDGKRVASGKDFDASTGQLKNKNAVLIDEKRSGALAKALRAGLPWSIGKVEEKPGQQSPYPPFTTSTLQQEGNRKLGYPAKRTMQIAQELYEGVDLGGGERVGLITYMRTDSVTLSEKALRDSQSTIRKIYGADYARGPRQYKTKTRNAQEAHEAIRPTEVSRRPQDVAAYLSKQQLAVYELIWKRTIASQMPNAELLRTTVEIAAQAGAEKAIFTASGKKILFPGFLRAYVEGSDDPNAELGDQETVLPDLREGQKILEEAEGKLARIDDPQGTLFLAELENKRHQTQPPARYTEAALVKKLEEEGIGRPSTYASIISTIQDRGYCFVNKSRQLVPTFTAMVVTNLLRDHFGHYVDYKFTAHMEEELDQISNGEMPWVKQVDEFYRGTAGNGGGLEALVDEKKETLRFAHLFLGNDPENGKPVQVRVGKYGPYIARGENGAADMANVPRDMAPADLTLQEAVRLLNAKAEGPRVLGTHPDTGESVYAMTGRFGDYVQLGENPEDKKAPKPRRQSLDPGQTVETVTLEDALRLLAFPKQLGQHPDDGEPIIVNKGKYGPYVQHNKEYRSLKEEDNPNTVDLARALELLAEEKPKRGARRGASSKSVIKELGEQEGKKIQVLAGRYGPYVTDGTTNATLPKSKAPESVTMEEASKLLAEKAAQGPKKKPARRGGKK